MKKIRIFAILVGLASVVSVRAETIIALTSNNRLLTFDSASPGTIVRAVNVTGVSSVGHRLDVIDFRPATGSLNALTDPSCPSPSDCSSDLYTINLATGAATRIGSAPVSTASFPFGPPRSCDIDFDPTADRIRYTNNRSDNVRINPDDAHAARDAFLAYANGDVNVGKTPLIAGSAYTNNFVGATAPILYDIDSTLGILVYQDPANAGFLHTVGSLGVTTTDNVGFDVSQGTGTAYASLTVSGVTGLYTINLASGAATLVGPIADATSLNGETLLDIAVPTATRLVNISSRGIVGTGENVLIGGFISRGGGRVVLRALGPSLGAFGVGNPLADPVLTLKDNNGATLAINDDWQSSQAADIAAAGLAPTNTAESAILTSLPAGSYTGVVSGKGNATGVAVVEIYQLP
jgi:hypothetical protein